MTATPPCPQALHDKLRRELRDILTLLADGTRAQPDTLATMAAAAAPSGQAAKLLRDYQHFVRLLEATAVPGSAHVRWVRK